MAKYIASKLSFNQDFPFYSKTSDRTPSRRIGGVTILGGCNVRNEHTKILTTDGIITEVSDEDAARLAEHPLFKMYLKNGMMRIVSTRKDARKASADLDKKDGAAQLTKEDYKKAGRAAPKAVASIKPDEDEE